MNAFGYTLILLGWLLSAALVPCAAAAGTDPAPPNRAVLENFGAPENARVLARLHQPPASSYFHYVQIGDSHTAGDYLTEELRSRLQQVLGDGGLGWAAPAWPKGQRFSRIGYDQPGWNLLSSRSGEPADYPFGGFIAQPGEEMLKIKAKLEDSSTQQVTAILKLPRGRTPFTIIDDNGTAHRPPAHEDKDWFYYRFSTRLPFSVIAGDAGGAQIGGWWLRGEKPGAIVSAAGINGAQLKHLGRWRQDWVKDLAAGKPDLVALAYGTNESVDPRFDPDEFRDTMESTIDALRRNIPGVAVLIIGAPEALGATAGPCGTRTPALDAVQATQRQVAQSKRTLYWNWQQAMSGPCSMKRWMLAGLARQDGVHFSADGYQILGDRLFNGLMCGAHPAGKGAREPACKPGN